MQFYTSFSLRENNNNEYLLTDVLEVHFIEMPKFRGLKEKNLKSDKLQRWMMFLRNDISQKELEVLIDMDNDIKKAEEKLEYLSSDPVTQELYFERERALHEKANLINTGLRKGREEGIQKEKIDTVIRLNSIGLTIDQVAAGAGITIEQAQDILNQNLN